MNKQRWEAIKSLAVPPPRTLHVASEPLVLPLVDFDQNSRLDAMIDRGEVRDIQYQTLANGTLRRVARTKGVTYRRYPAGKDRAEHRARWSPAA